MPRPHPFAIGIYLLALLIRLIPVVLARGLGIGLDDMFQYDMLARSLASGNGYRWYAREDLRLLEPYVDFDLADPGYDPVRGVATTFRAPLYPAFLALVYSISGTGFGRFFAARVAQAFLLGAALAPLTYFTARALLTPNPDVKANTPDQTRLTAERAARRSAWIIALYPLLLIFPLGLGTENLFFPLVLAAFLILLQSVRRPATFHFLFSGVLLGLAALTRSVILPFAGLAILWVWFGPAIDDLLSKRLTPDKKSPLRGLRAFAVPSPRRAFVLALAFLLTILPWVIRNSTLSGRPTGIETSLGYNLYVGYHPKSDGSFTFGPSLELVAVLDDLERDRLGTVKAIEFMQSDPGRFVPLAVSRLGHFFRLELRLLAYFYSSNFFGHLPAPLLLGLAALLGFPFAAISLSAVFGAALLPLDRRSLLLGLLFMGYLIPHVFILSEERFHLTLVPFLAILAAHFWTLGFSAVKSRFGASRAGWLTVTLVSAASILLIVNWVHQIGSGAARFALLLGPNGNQTYFPY